MALLGERVGGAASKWILGELFNWVYKVKLKVLADLANIVLVNNMVVNWDYTA